MKMEELLPLNVSIFTIGAVWFWSALFVQAVYKGENLRHDDVLITVYIFSIKRK